MVRGDNRQIHTCVWCKTIICTCCYVQHIARNHEEKYK
jgi:hypothetical protein